MEAGEILLSKGLLDERQLLLFRGQDIDYETQRRTVKRSGEWYRDLIARTRAAREATA